MIILSENDFHPLTKQSEFMRVSCSMFHQTKKDKIELC